MTQQPIVFVGGGHMASALIGGLLAAGRAADSVWVIEPSAPQRAQLEARFGLRTLAAAGPDLTAAGSVVWAVKPQIFATAAPPCAAFLTGALHLSVMAGIRSDAIARATGSPRIVRAMPNTPALIGQGIAGLYARPEVQDDGRRFAEQLLVPTGATLWVEREADLDAVTALSGSGPAYVFYLIEAMMEAGQKMGLSAEQSRTLAQATVAGAAALATQSDASPTTLREQVTSKGGTTHAAISALQASGVGPAIVQAVLAAQRRAVELGDEFGA